MCSAAYNYVKHCTLCQLHAPKAPAAHIQGHVQAEECAQVVTADIVHMPDASGNKYMLTVLDIFSRYGDAVPLTAATALEVTIAMRDTVLPNGWGRPEMWVIDGGSEFKAELTEALEAWDAEWRESAPEHPESHGAIERYNRTLCNKIAKLMDEQKTENWTEVRAAAVEATRQSVSEAISDAGAPVSPSEVWHGGRQVSMENAPSVRDKKGTNTGMSRFAQNLKSQVQKVVDWVKQSNDRYHENMVKRTAGKPVRTFCVGDEVTKFKSSRSKKQDKTSSKQEGPFKITAVHDSGVTYSIRKIGSDNREVKAHVNNLRAYRRFSEYKGEIPVVQKKQAATKHAKQYVVEAIAGERESKEGQQQFLIKWEGHAEHTWEPEDNLHCAGLIREWTKLSKAQQKARYNKANRRGIAATVADARTEEDETLCALIS